MSCIVLCSQAGAYILDSASAVCSWSTTGRLQQGARIGLCCRTVGGRGGTCTGLASSTQTPVQSVGTLNTRSCTYSTALHTRPVLLSSTCGSDRLSWLTSSPPSYSLLLSLPRIPLLPPGLCLHKQQQQGKEGNTSQYLPPLSQKKGGVTWGQYGWVGFGPGPHPQKRTAMWEVFCQLSIGRTAPATKRRLLQGQGPKKWFNTRKEKIVPTKGYLF